MAEVIYTIGTAPATPPVGKVTTYAKTDGLVYSKNETGVETVLSSAGLTQEAVLNRISLRA